MAEPRPQAQQNQVDGVLQDYLDQLLITATVSVPVSAPAPVVSTDTADAGVPVRRQESVAPLRKVTSERPAVLKTAAPAVDLLPQTVTVPDVVVTDIPASADADEPVAEIAAHATPELNWRSSQGIECLIFKVAGLKLAIPLPLLGGVYPVTDKVTPLFGQAAWSLGVWQGDDSKLTIIDSAQLIMPERGIQLRDAGYQFFIQLDRSPWALACQEICDTVTLVYDSIKWRGEGSKRPWLAGTVIAEMCALLDVPGIMQLLEQQRRPEPRKPR